MSLLADTIRPFDRSAYAVLLHRRHGYAPSFHRRGQYHQQASIAQLLRDTELTDRQRTLLTYIKEHDGFMPIYRSEPVDLGVLFPLLAGEGIAVVCSTSPYDHRQVTVDLAPRPVRVAFVHTAVHHPVYTSQVRHEVDLTLPDEREPHHHAPRSVWTRSGAHVVHETDVHLRLYPAPGRWSELLGRVQAIHKPDERGAQTFRYVGATLRTQELAELPNLCTAVPEHIELSVPQQVRDLVVHRDPPRRMLRVDLESERNLLRIGALVDYGVWQSDLAEEIAPRSAGRVRYVRRDTWAHTGDHVLSEEGGVLHLTLLDDQEEVAFYRELTLAHRQLGFTATLTCTYRGKTAVERYVRDTWPTVRAFAAAQGCEIAYVHDSLPGEQAFFRADFTSEVDTARDLLHFDVSLYCGEEKVSLAALHEFMASGATYWRKEDGTLVAVGNRAELERLARLIQSFRERDTGGFDGGLHHAPELSYVMASSPYYRAARSASLTRLMKRIQSGKPVKAVRLPPRIRALLRPYQRAGVAWLYFLRSYRFAGILADDMGLGKTVQTLTVLSLERTPGTPSLVVCPKSLLYNWKQEAATFFPDLSVLVYEGSPAERERLRGAITAHDLVVVSYHTLKQDADALLGAKARYNYAVLDEAQYIKNHTTKVAQCVKAIPAAYRLALTGTPLENHVLELWSMYDYLMPGFLGEQSYFARHFHKPIMDDGDRDALTHLRKKVENFMLRRTKHEVLAELPPKVEQVRTCVLTDTQNVLYQQILADVRGEVFGAVEEHGFRGAHLHILAGLMKLRQVCNHPALLLKEEDYTAYDSAKLDACLEIVEEVAAEGRKVLVFSQFTSMLDILSDVLTKRDIAHAYLSGKTRKRQEVIERFTGDPRVPVFLISTKAGGTGLNLTAADTVIVFDPWWNPSVENQAIDRAHRIGQTQSVNVYRLVTKGTIEERIQELKTRKQALFDAVIEESGDLFKKLTWDDVRALFEVREK